MNHPDYSRRAYMLQGKEAVEIDWKTWLTLAFTTHSNPRVDEDAIGESRISTVFLGIDHAHRDGPPMIFETRVFGGPCDGEMDRCSTWEQAEVMHAQMCDRVRAELQKPGLECVMCGGAGGWPSAGGFVVCKPCGGCGRTDGPDPGGKKA